MIYNFPKNIVIGLGGSVICPKNIDIRFLKNFKKTIEFWVKEGRKFIIVTGGGRLSREYQEAAEKIFSIDDINKDRIGIQATRLNAQLIRSIFGKNADLTVVSGRDITKKKLHYPITVASGWIPGRSTDFVAAQMAVDFKIKEIIAMGKPDYVYNKDNQVYKDAQPFFEMKWKDYRKLLPKDWKPGAHAPVDTVAAQFAQRRRLKMIIIGKSLKNLNNLLKGTNFKGTIVSN